MKHALVLCSALILAGSVLRAQQAALKPTHFARFRMNNVALADVFETLRESTGIVFRFETSIKNLKVPTLSLDDTTVERVLQELLPPRGLIYEVLDDHTVVIKKK